MVERGRFRGHLEGLRSKMEPFDDGFETAASLIGLSANGIHETSHSMMMRRKQTLMNLSAQRDVLLNLFRGSFSFFLFPRVTDNF